MSEELKEIIEITDDNFQEETSNGIVLVDFYAQWCSPCKALARTIEYLCEEFGDKVKMFKADIETNSNSVANFGINSVPSVLMFKNGEMVSKHVGLRSKKDLKEDLKKIIGE